MEKNWGCGFEARSKRPADAESVTDLKTDRVSDVGDGWIEESGPYGRKDGQSNIYI